MLFEPYFHRADVQKSNGYAYARARTQRMHTDLHYYLVGKDPSMIGSCCRTDGHACTHPHGHTYTITHTASLEHKAGKEKKGAGVGLPCRENWEILIPPFPPGTMSCVPTPTHPTL